MANPPSRLRNILGHLSLAGSVVAQDGRAEPRHQQPQPPNAHQLSPAFFLERAAAIEPDAEAIYHITANGKILRRSYTEFADRARGLAYHIKKNGLGRVGILAPNTPAFLESIYGIVSAGGVMVPVNYRLKPEDIAYILDFAEVDAVIVDFEYEHLLDVYRRDHAGTRIIVDTDTDATEGQLSGPFDDAILEGLTYDHEHGSEGWGGLHSQCANDDDTIALPFTSGTTSRPKGVIYTHRGMYLAALANVVESGLNYHAGQCRFLWTLPLFHACGWTFPFSIAACRGTNVCLRRVDYPLIWRLLKDEGITHFNAAPTVNLQLCAAEAAERLPNPVRVTVAASAPSAHLLQQLTALNLHPVHVYGLTETYGPITRGYYMPGWDRLPPHDRFARMARQGHGFVTSLPARVVKTGGPEDEVVDVAKDGKEIGEVVFSGNICCKGYYKDPEATRKLFAGGVLHTGDLAVWHPDGSLQIQDRAKDIIISGGENISSVALESMLADHPEVLEAGVVAVPDSHWGERPRAYVTAQEGKVLDPEQVIQWAKTQSSISRFMVPREVEVVAELPKTSTGKIKKNVLREWARSGRSQ